MKKNCCFSLIFLFENVKSQTKINGNNYDSVTKESISNVNIISENNITFSDGKGRIMD
jgi:hypothetical protein